MVLANAEELSDGVSAASGLAFCAPAILTPVCEVRKDGFSLVVLSFRKFFVRVTFMRSCPGEAAVPLVDTDPSGSWSVSSPAESGIEVC